MKFNLMSVVNIKYFIQIIHIIINTLELSNKVELNNKNSID